MTTDLEKQFFDTFGIEPREEKYCYWECKKPKLENVACNNTECEHYRHKIHYPQITDRILLELICLIAKELNCFTNYSLNYEHLKEYILKEMILEKDNFTKRQVQALFKDE